MFGPGFPLILIAASLAALLYVWGRQILGPLAAVGAVFVYVLDPTILAHSHLVTTDVGLAAFTVLSMFAALELHERSELEAARVLRARPGGRVDGEVLGRIFITGGRTVAAGRPALAAESEFRKRAGLPEATRFVRAAPGLGSRRRRGTIDQTGHGSR